MPKFIPGLKLNERYYKEIVKPLMKEHFPKLPYAVGLIGHGSDVLGYDNETSMDHNWGPHLEMFLRKTDHKKYAKKIDRMLQKNLPLEFMGFPTNFTEPDPDSYLKVQMKKINKGPVNHFIHFRTIQSFLKDKLGFDRDDKIKMADWLTFPEQALLEVTSGKVFHDDTGELTAIRKELSYFPDDIWYYCMGVQWGRLGLLRSFPSRDASMGDELGSMINTFRLITEMITLGFLIGRKYAPYSKWVVTAFKELTVGKKLIPVFMKIKDEKDWRKRQNLLNEAQAILARRHNQLKITKKLPVRLTDRYKRGYKVFDLDIYLDAVGKKIKSPKLRRMKYPLGKIDQFTDHIQINKENQVFLEFKSIIK